MWKFGIASIASLCVLSGGMAIAGPIVLADAPATAPAGTDKIEGKVVDQNGQAVPNATVLLFAAMPGHKPAPKPADPTAVRPGQSAQDLAAGARAKHTPLQQTTTAADGTFSFTGLADGKYQVIARVKGVGNGHEEVTLSAAHSDGSVTLTLAPHKPRGEKPAGN